MQKAIRPELAASAPENNEFYRWHQADDHQAMPASAEFRL